MTLEEMHAVDPKDMYRLIKEFPAQAREAIRIGKEAPLKISVKGVREIVLCGLGGSAIGGIALGGLAIGLLAAGGLALLQGLLGLEDAVHVLLQLGELGAELVPEEVGDGDRGEDADDDDDDEELDEGEALVLLLHRLAESSDHESLPFQWN